QQETGNLTTTTYYVVTSTCTFSGLSNTSPEFMMEVRPIPSASATNDSPICEGEDVQLTGTTDIGTEFSWTGPAGYSSEDQSPLLTSLSESQAGDYTFTSSLNGCTSEPAATNIAVNLPPNVTVTADPNPICSGGSTQLEVLASGASPYCEAYSNQLEEHLSNVNFAGINNSSGPSNYTDYTNISGNVVAGNSYIFSATVLNNVATSAWNETVWVFIDWDQNGVFEGNEVYD